tara:strand:+ start:149 stop:634 length:486 start_codon:yes stop_codon:yes gene_type:complete
MNKMKKLLFIVIAWYEGRPIEVMGKPRYNTRENIQISNKDNNAWLELQEFMKDVFNQREEMYKDADYMPYSKVKLLIEWSADKETPALVQTIRVDVGDSPDFNPYKEWIGDYIYNENPEKYDNFDMGQDQIFSERYVKDSLTNKEKLDKAMKLLQEVINSL